MKISFLIVSIFLLCLPLSFASASSVYKCSLLMKKDSEKRFIQIKLNAVSEVFSFSVPEVEVTVLDEDWLILHLKSDSQNAANELVQKLVKAGIVNQPILSIMGCTSGLFIDPRI